MKKFMVVLSFFIATATVFSSNKVVFKDYFENSTMRVDFYITGDASSEIVTIDEIYQQGVWAGNPLNLIDEFIKGAYFIKIYDVASNKLIFSRGFDCIFSEYKTTNPAIKGEKRSYHHSALFPMPRHPVRFVLEMGDRQNVYRVAFVKKIDPAGVDIRKEEPGGNIRIYKALNNGDPHNSVDLVWLAEGYTSSEWSKFRKDVDRYVKNLFSYEPYKSNRKKFNITGVFCPSAESGVDEPTKGKYVASAVNASFNAFHIPRYMLTEDNKTFRNLAAHVPYDAIVIMVNSKRYGGGGIYNFYGLTSVDHQLSEKVFVHEFGHSFAGLADEYYSSSTAYNEFYPPGIEPAEPNITALLNPEHVKWEKYLSVGLKIPTDWGKVQVEELEKKRNVIYNAVKKLQETNSDESTAALSLKQAEMSALSNEIAEVRKRYSDLLTDKVGVFEGAGYSSEGLFRPEIECLMHSNARNRFCKVCQEAIQYMIDFFTVDI